MKCIDEEIPFDIPQGWEWTRLSRIVYNHGQKAPDEVFSYIDIGSIDNVNQKLNSKETILNANEAPSRARRIIRFGDIIYSTVRPYLHNTCIIDRTFLKPAIASTGFAVFACHRGLINKYLFNYLLTPQFDAYANDKNNAKGVAYPAINDEKLYKALVPVPPTNEQNRIINIIEQLSPYVSRYSEAASVLKSLNTQLGESLKRSILQQAIQGKLVPQDPSDEPASELLKRIREEKLRLVKEGKLKKKDITDSVIFKGDDNRHYEKIGGQIVDISEDIPFDLPYNWCWCRFSNIASMTIGKTPARGEQAYWINGKYNWVSISDMVDGGTISSTKEKVSDLAVKEILSAPISEKGSLLMSFKLSIGKTSILDIDAYHNEAIITIRPVVDKEYSMRNYLFKVLPLIANLGESKDAIKGKTLNSRSLANLLIPLPPLQEQQRIIERINLLSKQLQ